MRSLLFLVLGEDGVVSSMRMNNDLLPTILGLAGVPHSEDRIMVGEDDFAMWQGAGDDEAIVTWDDYPQRFRRCKSIRRRRSEGFHILGSVVPRDQRSARHWPRSACRPSSCPIRRPATDCPEDYS